jgi:FtsZ-binding cell division protein ZapB
MQTTSDTGYKSLYEQTRAQLAQALSTIALLQQRIEQLEKRAFGSKQERFVPSASPVALEPSATVAVSVKEQTKQHTSVGSTFKDTTAKKPLVHPGRGKLPEHLRRKDIVLEPVFVPQGSIKIGELITEQPEYRPAEL